MTVHPNPTPVGELFEIQRLADIEKVLREMWAASSDGSAGADPAAEPRVRVNLGNLAIITEKGRGVELDSLLDRLSVQRPSRVIIAEVDDDRTGAAIRAYISVACHRVGPDRPQVCCERIHLECGGGGGDLLAGIIVPLLEADLPSVLWWDRPWEACEDVFIRLIRNTGTVLIDLGRPGALGGVRTIRTALEGIGIHDLAWIRIERWRRELAHIFDDASMSEALRSVRSVRIEAFGGESVSAEALLFMGWLVAQLGWKLAGPLASSPAGYRTSAAGHDGDVALEICEPASGDRPSARSRQTPASELHSVIMASSGEIEVRLEREPSDGTLSVQVHRPETCPLPRRTSAGNRSTDEIVGEALELGAALDPIYEKALGEALKLAPLES